MLDSAELHSRLGAFEKKIPQASSLALTFGAQLLEEVMNRSSQIDSKGMSVLGWSSALLAFLLVNAPKIYASGSIFAQVLGSIAMILAFLAAFSGMWASRTREWRGVSDETWFPDPDLMMDGEHIRQHYLAELHELRSTWDSNCRRKVDWLRIGQNCLAAAGFLVLLILLYALVSPLAGFGLGFAATFRDG